MLWVKKNNKKIISGKGGGASIRHSRVGTKFCPKITLLNFRIKLTQKSISELKN